MTTITGEKELNTVIKRLLTAAPQATRDAINEHGIAIQAQARRNLTDLPAVDTGRLRSSIKVDLYKTALGYTGARVGSDVKYAPFVEFGSKPHFPPLEPIRQWCRRHRIDESAAYAIALKISRTGQPAKPYLFPAYEQERPNFQKHIREAWRALNKQLT